MSAQEIEHKIYTPAPFQVEDLEQLAARDWSANWSEMGCYKTTTVEWLIERKLRDVPQARVLIITTKSGKGTYFQTIPEVLPGWQVVNVQSKETFVIINGQELKLKDFPTEVAKPTIYVTHYDVFSQRKPKKIKENDKVKSVLEQLIAREAAKKNKTNLQMMLEQEWDFIILDEAHRIKSKDTGWTKNIKKLKGKYRHIMTGTGFVNNPAEIWSLLHFLNRRLFSSYWKFRTRYCEEEINDFNGYRVITGLKEETKEEFRDLRKSVGPRRTKVEVFKNLPHPIFSPVEVDLNPAQRRMYDSIKSELEAMDEAGTPMFAPNVISALQRLRQICVATPFVESEHYDEEKERRVQVIRLKEPSSKLDALMELIGGLEWDDERHDQLVVFSNFKDPIQLAKARFDEAGISYIEMKQGDNDQTRYNKWAIEFPKKEHQVFITTLQLGSESISLTSATTVVFLDRSWSPKDNEQGVSRVWRPGQDSVANVVHINAKNTVDQYVEAKVNRKMGWFREIFGDDVGR